jgi:hypothetical protein
MKIKLLNRKERMERREVEIFVLFFSAVKSK